MNRAKMIAELEQYWYEFYAQNPDEPMGDIPGAVEYYWQISDQELVWEYEQYIGKVACL